METSGEVMEVDKQLKFKSHQCMQVEFISNNVDVMTHDCSSSVALALGNRGMMVEAAPQCAKDRKEWRALVHM